jgi:hypothetical protein
LLRVTRGVRVTPILDIQYIHAWVEKRREEKRRLRMLKIHLGNNQLTQRPKETASHPIDLLSRVPSHLLQGFNLHQLNRIEEIIEFSLPKPSPKVIDLRVDINLFISRFYFVILVGKDCRQKKRPHTVLGLTRLANILAAIGILTGINLTVSCIIFISLYLIKSWLGINLLKDMHLIDVVNNLLGYIHSNLI